MTSRDLQVTIKREGIKYAFAFFLWAVCLPMKCVRELWVDCGQNRSILRHWISIIYDKRIQDF